MSVRWRDLLFALVCAAQIAVPASMIVQHERTRANGTPWRFQTAPVDPNDPFRGRYVQLDFAAGRQALFLVEREGAHVRLDDRLYAELVRDESGFARLGNLHQTRPEAGEYLDVFVRDIDYDREGGPPSYKVRLPFDRFYLPETKAPEVERAYAEASRKARERTYAEVRVSRGHAALVSLVLDGKSVSD